MVWRDTGGESLPFDLNPHEHFSPETWFSSLAREQVHEPAARAPGGKKMVLASRPLLGCKG